MLSMAPLMNHSSLGLANTSQSQRHSHAAPYSSPTPMNATRGVNVHSSSSRGTGGRHRSSTDSSGNYQYTHPRRTSTNGTTSSTPIMSYSSANSQTQPVSWDTLSPNSMGTGGPFLSLSAYQTEERKPTLGLNGSPHNSTTHALPPLSPAPSNRSRESPVDTSFEYDNMYFNQASDRSPANTNALHTISQNASPFSDSMLGSNLPTLGYTTGTGYATPPGGSTPGSDNGMRTRDEYEYDIAHLKNENSHLRNQLSEMRQTAELQNGQQLGQQLSENVDPRFMASWRHRTEAREKQLCSLNRAGNALCAWHDPRRERRQYPPRMAPSKVLNCGCTYEQALFEETLTRHGVGAYQPGNTVRMDPVLRNPLLKLLKERYGYKDGDFERIPVVTSGGLETWTWPEGDGPQEWISGQAQVGNSTARR